LQLELIVVNPTLVEAREIIASLTPWIERACASLIASFARGVAQGQSLGGKHFALIQRTD